jgi:sialate O-acetylesterase
MLFRMKPLNGICFLALFCLFGVAHAQLKLPIAISDHMVLQRDQPVPIWGKAFPNANVTVSFKSQKKSTQADASGAWRVVLEPMTAADQPDDMVVEADKKIIIRDVLVGDVWLCSGQSNMEYPLDRMIKRYAGPQRGIDRAMNAWTNEQPSAIRYMYVERLLTKSPELPSQGWHTGADTLVRYASAIGYFFAKEVYEKTKVPIGIITSAWGGTRIEAWVPEDIWKESTVFKDSAQSTPFTIDGARPAVQYRAMIAPLVPMAMKGVLWYQGESNVMIHDQATYPEKFRLLVESWRRKFQSNQMPFYYVQLVPYLYSARKDKLTHSVHMLPLFWEAQSKGTQLPHAHMVVTTDLVDKLSDIHPSYKWEIGHRLALSALQFTYQFKLGDQLSPVFESARRKKNELIVSFTYASDGLRSADGKEIQAFEIADSKGVFYPAQATLTGNKVRLRAAQVRKPQYVRFAWHEAAQPNLVNAFGLPCTPFRNDEFTIPK